MTTTMSCFKKEQFLFLYRFSLKKTAGWTAIYTILLFLCYPLILFKEAASMANRYPDYPDRMNMLLSRMTVTSFMVSALLCAMVLVFSAVLYAYMHGKRSADFFHSMPVERSVMLSANFAAGFTNLVLPIWLNSLIAALAYPIFLPMADYGQMWKLIALEVLAWTIGAFVLLAISTMVAVTVATAVENVGYTVALLLEGSLILLIWDLACSTVFTSYPSIFDGRIVSPYLANLLYYLSPVFALARTILGLLRTPEQGYALSLKGGDLSNWLPLLFWLVLGLAALWLAMKIYKNRQSERAEQWGRQSLIGFVVKLMSAIIGAFLFGGLLGTMLGLENRFLFTFGALTGAPLVYLVIEAITNRGFHNMKKCLPYLCAALAITLTGSLYFAFDGFGYDERVPEASEVKTVTLELSYGLAGAKKSDAYAKGYSESNEWGLYGSDSDYVFDEENTIELITEIHKASIDGEGNYWCGAGLSYDKNFGKLNRRIDIRNNNADRILELLHCDEFLNEYSPFFELKGSYLKLVQISDKLGNLVGDGAIPAEGYDKLLSAIRDDQKNATPELLRDTENNGEVAVLTFVTKYPKDIYEESGELYHYDITQNYTVRQNDTNTRLVLEELGYKPEITEESCRSIKSIQVIQGWNKGYLPGVSASNDGISFESYEYYVSDTDVTDPALILRMADKMTTVYNGYGNQYGLVVYFQNDNSKEIYTLEFYLDRSVMAQIMAESGNFSVPYILTDEEWTLINSGWADPYVSLEEGTFYIDWREAAAYKDAISMKAYCEQHCPQVLEGKSAAELLCMEKTPLVNSQGEQIRVSW